MLSDAELRGLLDSLHHDGRGQKETPKKELIVRDFLRTRSSKETAANLDISVASVWNAVARYRLVARHVLERTDAER